MVVSEEKIINAICFFASEHERRTGDLLSVDLLHKYLVSLGLKSFEKKTWHGFGLVSRKTETMRMFARVDGKRIELKDDRFAFVHDEDGYAVKATGSPDLSCFSPFELFGMKRTVETGAAILAKRVDSGLDIREAKRRIWIEDSATNIGRYGAGDQRFSTGLPQAPKASGLAMLVVNYEKQVGELECRLAETRRKLETIMETLRLLEEEGLSRAPR